jgi:hypothetical protein
LIAQRADALTYLETLLRYLAQAAGNLDETLLRQALVQALPDDIGDAVMPTLAETWIEQGKVATLRSTLRRLLVQRFGALSPDLDQRIEQADAALLEQWFERGLTASSLQEALNSHTP